MMNIEKIEALGANRWTKNGYDRLYINLDMVEAACDKYNDGIVPMNRRAKGNFKMWIEVETGEIKSQGMGNYTSDIEAWVEQYINEMTKEEEESEVTTEYAIINTNIENVPEEDAEVIIKAQDAQDIISKLAELEADGEDMDDYTIEEYKVDADGEFAEGSDYDTAENFRKRFGTWYAVQSDAEDNDWGTGSYELAEAKRMAAQYPTGRIALIDMTGSEPMCIGYEEV